MALINTEELVLACIRIAGLEPDEHNADFTVKNKFPLREEQKKKIESARHIYKHFLSEGFIDGEKYNVSEIASWLCSQVVETDNKYNIIIYDKYSRRFYFRYDYKELINPEKIQPTPFKESKHTSELLQIMQMFIADKWENCDKSPVNGDALEWAASKGIVISSREAKAIDLITKPNKYKNNNKSGG